MVNLEIRVASGPKAGKTIMLSNGQLSFGRTKGDIITDWDPSTSSRHFKIEKQNDGFFLQDLGSTYGTFLNGSPVKSKQLMDGDKIIAGNTLFTVHVSSTDSPEIPTPYSTSEYLTLPDEFPAQEAVSSYRTSLEFESVASNPIDTAKPVGIYAGENSSFTLNQVRVRVNSSKSNDSVFWLAPGQSLVFGRTAKSDCEIPSDPTLSARHFRVSCFAEYCEVEDLQSRSGITLNGQKLTKANVFDGDCLRAGNTEFAFEIDSDQGPILRQGAAISETNRPAMVEQPNDAIESVVFDPYRPYNVPSTDPETAVDVTHREVARVAIRSICPSGLVRLHGDVGDDDTVTQIAVKLIESPNLLIIDFSRLGMEIPPKINIYNSSPFLNSFIDAVEFLPLVLETSELPNWEQKLEVGWSKDAAIIIRAELEKAAFIEALGKLVCPADETNRTGIAGVCWPSVLSSILFANPGGIGSSFMELVTAAFFAGPDSQEQWQLFASQTMLDELSNKGVIQFEDHASYQNSE